MTTMVAPISSLLFFFAGEFPVLALDPAKVAIIKADDFRNEFSSGQQWTNFLSTNRALGVKIGVGVICTNIVGSNSNLISQWMRAQEAVGDVEFWDHAWDHTQWTNTSSQLVQEYMGSGLAYMQQHLAQSQAALSNALGHDVIAFGTPYNSFDTNTAAVINATPALRLFFASSINTVRNDGLSNRVTAVYIISESDGTGLPNATKFTNSYPGGPKGPVSLQFHPASFVSNAGTNSLLEYQKIVQYLQANGYSLLLPSAFVACFPAITNQPLSRSAFVGSTTTFSVSAGGDAPLTYQWLFNGTQRVGATNVSLTLTNLQSTNAGNYTVIVTNAFGSSTSSVAALTVMVPLILNFTNGHIGQGYVSNRFYFTLTGPAGSNAVISASTNLQTWTPLLTNTLGSGTMLFTDMLATNYFRRFYRAALGP